jgi:hypothetical protein
MLHLLDKLMTKLDRKRLVYDRVDGELYLTRYYIFLKERTKFPFNIFLHRFHKSDEEVLHDHPWSYATLILKGGYYEWNPVFNSKQEKIGEICTWRGPGHFRVCGANSYHRVELDPGVTCWTLFMPGPKKRDWGFLVKGQWVQWEEYLKNRKAQA